MKKDSAASAAITPEELYSKQLEANPAFARCDIPTLVQALSLQKSSGLKMLDLGCGTGICTGLLKQQGGGKVLGVDIDEAMIKKAKQTEAKAKFGVTYCVGDCKNNLMTVPEVAALAPFDVVNVCWVLPHLKTCAEVKAMATNIFVLLKPGGKVCGVTFNPHLDKEMTQLHERYGLFNSISTDPTPEDQGRLVHRSIVTVPKLPPLLQTNYLLKDYQLATAFHEAGFKDFHFVPPPFIFETDSEAEKEFYQPYLLRPQSAIFIATKTT
jgi:2-polyprenyl-3-methyl-5-hydroxy-6-metoxy-1,4-benzoquinol methylase